MVRYSRYWSVKPHEETPPNSWHRDLSATFPLLTQDIPLGKYHRVHWADHRKLGAALTNYGHYLDQGDHDKLSLLLSHAELRGEFKELSFRPQTVYYPDTNYGECLEFIKEHRTQLTSDLYKITYKRKTVTPSPRPGFLSWL